MEKVLSALGEIKKINDAYEISTDAVIRLEKEMAEAKVCTPIIGRFSSGKSALVNTILGYNRKLLREDITPETAVPAEIVYTDGEDLITVLQNDGTVKTMSVEEYRNFEADANTVKSVRIQLRNSFLEDIPDVMLVDMPGFESGFEVHNKAIDNYLPQSLAYIVAFPADDMIVRSSVGNILKELCLYDMPLCIVITMYDKKNDEFDITFEKMKKSLRRFVGDREITYCRTSSFTGEREELEDFLKGIQEKSQDILAANYKKAVYVMIENTENYLKTILNNSQLSESELDEQEEKLGRQMSSLTSNFSKEQKDFELEIRECVEEIKADVQCALEAEESTFVTMALNKQDINGRLNVVVRNAVAVSVKKRFIPRMERYSKKVSDTINNGSFGDVNVLFSFDSDKVNKGMTLGIVGVVAMILTGSLITGLITGLFLKFRGDKKREEAKQEIRMKLRNEVFPQVLRDVGNGIETTITKQVMLVNTAIEEELSNQKDILDKAMADVRNKMKDEKEKKENLAIDIHNDLERIGEIKDGLR